MLIQDGKLFFASPVLACPQPRLRIEKHQHDQSEQEQEPDEGSKSVHISLTAILPFNVQILQVFSFRVNFDREHLPPGEGIPFVDDFSPSQYSYSDLTGGVLRP